MLPLFLHNLGKNFVCGAEGDGEMRFGIQLAFRRCHLLLGEIARLTGVGSGLLPLLRRSLATRHP